MARFLNSSIFNSPATGQSRMSEILKARLTHADAAKRALHPQLRMMSVLCYLDNGVPAAVVVGGARALHVQRTASFMQDGSMWHPVCEGNDALVLLLLLLVTHAVVVKSSVSMP